MLFLRSLIFQILATLWTYTLAILGLPTLIDTRRLGGYTIGRLWGAGNLWLLKICCNIHCRIEGLENLPADGRMLIASKHQSAWDTAIYWPVLREPSFILKKELLRVPLFGWYLTRLHNIPIYRSGGGKAMKQMVAIGKVEAAHGRPLVIFPEGTRTAYGSKGEYHSGVALLAGQLGLPVIPVALNSGACWPRARLRKQPGTITLRFLPPLSMEGGTRAVLERLEKTIEDACAALPDPRITPAP